MVWEHRVSQVVEWLVVKWGICQFCRILRCQPYPPRLGNGKGFITVTLQVANYSWCTLLSVASVKSSCFIPNYRMKCWVGDQLTPQLTDLTNTVWWCGRLTDWQTDQLNDRLRDWVTHWLTYWQMVQVTDCEIEWSNDQLTDCLADGLINGLIDSVIYLCIDSRIPHSSETL